MSILSLIKKTDARSTFCAADTSVFDVAKKMAALNVNAMIVAGENGALAGIITDHDVIRMVVKNDGRLHDSRVSECMSTHVITCGTNEKLTKVMDLMGKHRIRHIVVVEDGKPVDVLGIKDILSKIHEDDELEARVLRDIALVSKASVV